MNAPTNTPVTPIPFNAEGPQPLLREIPKGEPYPVEALGPLREAVEAVADITQAPVGLAAQSALSVASLAVQGLADVETLGGDAPCSLFCLTIAESGERKSTCDRLLMKGVRDFEAEQETEYREEYEAFEVAHKIWTEKRKRLITEAAGAKREKAIAAEADLRAMGPEPRPPLFPKLTAMDPTFEGLMKLYGIGRPALGLFSDEAGGFIGGHAMNSDNRLKTMAGLSNLWNGEPIDRTRAGDGAKTYRGRRLAAHLMVQPIAAAPLLSDPEARGQGFLARFLMTEPPSAIGTRLRRDHAPQSRSKVEAFRNCALDILAMDLPTDAHPQELTPKRLTLSPAARELLFRFHDAVEASQGRGREFETVRAYASKSVEQAARIAGVFALWADPMADLITPENMAHGISLSQFYLGEAKRLSDAGAITVDTAKAEELRLWLVEKWQHNEIMPREIVQFGPNPLRESKAAKAALAVLEKHGWLIRLPEGLEVRGATRKEAYQIVRAQHVL
jgi:hypothetical protein